MKQNMHNYFVFSHILSFFSFTRNTNAIEENMATSS